MSVTVSRLPFRSFLAPYAALLRPPGRRGLVASAWLGRFPKSSLGLGTILMIALLSNSYAMAGAVSAVFAFALALSGPQWSRAMDRFGQALVLRIAAAALTLSSAMLLAAILAHWPPATWFVFAALSGLSVVDMGSAVRSRWASVLPPEDRPSAFALETINDELVFVIAPPLITVIAALVHPALGFAAGLATGVLGYLLFAARTGPSRRTPASSGRRGFWMPARIIGVVLAFAGLGAVFGSFDVATVALARHAGAAAFTGLIIGAFALASTLSGVVLGSRRTLPGSQRGRFLVAAGAFGVLVPALAFASTPVSAALLATVAGFVTSPLMITGLSLVEVRADIARLTETLAYPTAGLAIGGTLGALVCGVVVDSHGAQSGYLVTAVAAVFVALAALASEGVRSLVTTSDVGGVRRM